jgi:hypothetical protein
MVGEVLIEYAALTEAAQQEAEAADQVRAVDSIRVGATLPEGSLGKLPSSSEIQATFDEVWASAGDALDALGKACEGLADRLLDLREATREVDDTIGTAFDTMRGGS